MSRPFQDLIAAAWLALCTLLGSGAAFGQDLAAPQGKPVLTISGNIEVTNNGDTAQFDLAMLEAMGLVSFTTTTPWYEGPVTFEGVRLDALMEAVGASGEKVMAVALNDYTTEIPIADFARFGPIVAIKRDGQYMPVRDKGPLFIVYPYDSDTQLKSQTYYGRSAWQLAKLIVE